MLKLVHDLLKDNSPPKLHAMMVMLEQISYQFTIDFAVDKASYRGKWTKEGYSVVQAFTVLFQEPIELEKYVHVVESIKHRLDKSTTIEGEYYENALNKLELISEEYKGTTHDGSEVIEARVEVVKAIYDKWGRKVGMSKVKILDPLPDNKKDR